MLTGVAHEKAMTAMNTLWASIRVRYNRQVAINTAYGDLQNLKHAMGIRTTWLLPDVERVRYSVADYSYQPVFTPATTANGALCKRCLAGGKYCFQHRNL